MNSPTGDQGVFAGVKNIAATALAVGGGMNGVVEVAGDRDLFAVPLSAGVRYVFDLSATGIGALGDPMLRLFNGSGDLLGSDDDGGGGTAARLFFTPPANGTYFVGASDTGSSTGSYSLRAALADVVSPALLCSLVHMTGDLSLFDQLPTPAMLIPMDVQGAMSEPDKETVRKRALEIIADYRAAAGITPRKIGAPEVVERCIFALVNEGARILAEGVAARASDIDVVYLNGYGFPMHRGGPMLYADTVGLPNVVRALRRFAAEPGADPSWQPAPLLVQLADDGKTFN